MEGARLIWSWQSEFLRSLPQDERLVRQDGEAFLESGEHLGTRNDRVSTLPGTEILLRVSSVRGNRRRNESDAANG